MGRWADLEDTDEEYENYENNEDLVLCLAQDLHGMLEYRSDFIAG